MMKTALAPTVEMAAAKIERYIDKVKAYFYPSGQVLRWYKCDPSTSAVESASGDERWIEGNWGLHMRVNSFGSDTVYDLNNLSNAIEVSGVSVTPHDEHSIDLSIWLTARVMRE